jgi:TP901 family phage tail tape measure protein
MADRSVVVRLRADIASYASSMAAASKVTADFGKSAVDVAAKHKASWDKVGKGMMIGGAVIVAGIGLAVVAAAEFDQKMSTVKANVDDKSVPSMRRLADAALTAGKLTMFSAGQAADAENELAKAGLTAAQITGGALTAALSLASAGQIDLASAAEITASTMVQFGLAAKDAGHIADVLAAGADKSLGGVTDLAEALKYAGVPAAQFGVSLDTTVGVLAEFASNGILGSMAGTSLRMMMIRLASPTAEARGEMKQLGLTFFNAKGDFVGVSDMAGQLHTKLAGLTQQQREQTLVTLFGARSLSEANILYRDGAAGVDKWTKAVNDQGFAALQAATKLDNLDGDLTKLKASFNVLFISAGEGSQGPLRSVTQEFTNVLNSVAALPAPVTQAAVTLGAVTAAALLLGGTAMLATTRIAAMKTALMTMGVEGGKATSMIKGFAGAVGVAAVAIPLWQAAANGISTALGEVAPATNEAGRALLEFSTTGKATGNAADLINRHFGDLGNTVNNVFSSGLGHKVSAFFSQISPMNLIGVEKSETNLSIEFFKTLDSGLSNLVSSGHGAQAAAMFKRVTDEAKKQGVSIAQVADAFPQYSAAATAGAAASNTAAGAAGTMTAAQKLNAEAMKEQAKAADDATKANDALIKSMEAYGSLLAGQRDAVRGYYSAVDAASAALKANGKTLDVTTQKGRDNQAALDGVSTATLKMVGETFKNRDANTSLADAVAAATTQVNQGRAAFIKSATGFGMSTDAANKLADMLGLTTDNVSVLSGTIAAIPAVTTPKIDVNTGPASTKLSRLQAQLDRATADQSVSINYLFTTTGQAPTLPWSPFHVNVTPGHAKGGYVNGVGSGTSDSNLTPTSHGEYVVKAASVARLGRGFMDQVNSGRAPVASPAAGGSNTFNISEVSDPVGTAYAVARRLSMIGKV